jgi:hypothetical protein
VSAVDTIDSTAEDIGQELVPSPPPASLFRTDDPVEVIEKATAVANALKRVIESKQLFKRIGNRDHVLVEGWATLGSMLGVTGIVRWSRRIDPPVEYMVDVKHYSGPSGQRVVSKVETYKVEGYDWEARVEAVTADGRVIGAAEALCSRREPTWSKRDDYALRSMAQTRAMSKALRGPLGFVVTLAGYSSTPAEEVPEDNLRQTASRAAASRSTASRVTAPPAARTERMATAKQRGLINGRAAAAGLTSIALANIMLSAAGQDPREFASQEEAGEWLKRQLDRLPARLVNAVLEGIAEAAS